MIKLRTYQREAIDSIYEWFEESTGNPLIVVPTGGGKSVIIAKFIEEVLTEWPGERIMVATHVKELVDQNHQALLRAWPDAPAGIYSAGIGRRDTRDGVIFAGVQSAFRKPASFGHIDLLLVDEAHRIPKRSDGMYRKLIEGLQRTNPKLRIIGFTATPFRTESGRLDVGDQRMFHGVSYECDVASMIDAGWLSDLTNRGTSSEIDTRDVRTRAGEFVPGDLEMAAMKDDLVQRSVDELVERAADRVSWIVFCCGVIHANAVADGLRERGITCHTVFGETTNRERDERIAEFRAGKVRAIVNVGVLTTGFDVPHVDLIALLRPTQSPGLYVQMVGRGLRTAEHKTDCLVLDFGGNVMRHGPIDDVKTAGDGDEDNPPNAKQCPKCKLIVPLDTEVCPGKGCDHKWEKQLVEPRGIDMKMKVDASSSILKSQQKVIERWAVQSISYHEHTKRGAPPDHPKTLRVYYNCGYKRTVSEWVCFEHPPGSFPRRKAMQWWLHRGGNEPVPDTVDLARLRIELGEIRNTLEVVVDTRDEWPEIKGHTLEDPEDHARRNEHLCDASSTASPDYIDIPF